MGAGGLWRLAVSRHTDHLIDHFAEVHALLSEVPTEPDRWHGSAATMAVGWAALGPADLNEASQRLRRLARSYLLLYKNAGPDAWESSHEPNWILRQIAEHVADAWYAEQVGTLSGGISKHPDRRSVAIDGAVAASHVASPGGVAVRAPVRAAAAAMLAAWSAMAGLSGSPATNSR
jgi:hypothetical protein